MLDVLKAAAGSPGGNDDADGTAIAADDSGPNTGEWHIASGA